MTTTELTIDERAAKVLGRKGVMVGWCAMDCGDWEYRPGAENWTEDERHHTRCEQMVVALHAYDEGDSCVIGADDGTEVAHTEYCYEVMDTFSRSIDAQRPLEEMARAQGWWLEAIHELVTGWFLAGWAHDEDGFRRSEAPTEAEARALVLVEILEAEHEV